jgi:hypothetical protein
MKDIENSGLLGEVQETQKAFTNKRLTISAKAMTAISGLIGEQRQGNESPTLPNTSPSIFTKTFLEKIDELIPPSSEELGEDEEEIIDVELTSNFSIGEGEE